jgi:hypothetical protein
MATQSGKTVRCPVYLNGPSRGTATGCGKTHVKRLARTGFLFYECEDCGAGFGSAEVEYDRQVFFDPRLRASHDARIANGHYV